MIILVLLTILSSSQVFAAEAQLINKLAKDIQWLNLVHYKTSWTGKVESQTDGPLFFLSKDGKTSPSSELSETILRFRQDKTPLTDESAICKFPARYNWLKNYFNEFTLDPSKECKGFSEFHNKTDAQSVSLIFSSYHINTPASAFGHTFIRLNRTPHREDNEDQGELLDYGISYAAQMGEDMPILYAAKGLAGLYRGYFKAVPYYYKVREYNDYEFRDLWEYKLSFTQSQIDMMVAHIWELEHTWFDYLYLTENCAYHVLGLLEVGNPQLELTSELPPMYVIPVDTIRVVSGAPGLVVGQKYRPSVLSRLERQSAGWKDSEIKKMRDLAENPSTVEAVVKEIQDPVKKAKMLETVVEAYDFLNAKELVYRPANTIPERHELLVARSEVDVILPEVEIVPEKSEWPHMGHLSQRWGMSAGYRDNAGTFGTASMRFALHDFLDPLQGQPTFSQIIMGDFNFTFQQTDYSQFSEFKIENIDLFRVSSMQPITHWQRNTSWDGRIGTRTIRDEGCKDCFAITAEAGVGATVAPKNSENFISLLNKFQFDYSDDFKNPLRVAMGPELWWRWIPSTKLSFLAIVGYKWSNYLETPLFANQIFTQSIELRYHVNKNWSLALKGEGQQENNRAGSIGFYNFF